MVKKKISKFRERKSTRIRMAWDVKGIQGLKLEKMYAEFITSGALTDREVPLWKSFFVYLLVCSLL